MSVIGHVVEQLSWPPCQLDSLSPELLAELMVQLLVQLLVASITFRPEESGQYLANIKHQIRLRKCKQSSLCVTYHALFVEGPSTAQWRLRLWWSKTTDSFWFSFSALPVPCFCRVDGRRTIVGRQDILLSTDQNQDLVVGTARPPHVVTLDPN